MDMFYCHYTESDVDMRTLYPGAKTWKTAANVIAGAGS